jgi:hypothetical protein
MTFSYRIYKNNAICATFNSRRMRWMRLAACMEDKENMYKLSAAQPDGKRRL